MKEVIKSNKGFYVGDVCYALNDDIYYGIWGKQGYCDGKYSTPDGFAFAVAGTAYGDGEYEDQFGRLYGVDAGVIGVVPLELVKPEYRDGGQIFLGAGEATFDAEDGFFFISLPFGIDIKINTADEDEYDEDEEY
jgi:hypothetical protein